MGVLWLPVLGQERYARRLKYVVRLPAYPERTEADIVLYTKLARAFPTRQQKL